MTQHLLSIKDKLASLPPKERNFLTFVSAGLLTLLIIIVESSLTQKINTEKLRYEKSMNDLYWLKKNQHMFSSFKHEDTDQTQSRKASIHALSESSSKFNIQFNRVDKRKNGTIQVWIGTVEINTLLLWLEELKNSQQFTIEQVYINNNANNGTGDATISFR